MHIRSVLMQTVELINDSLPDIQARRFDIKWKEDGSPVTEADIFLEKKITAFLSEAIPGVIVFGEESYDAESTNSRDPEGWVAVLDPIDGTENFCSGFKEWGVSLSIWKGSEHMGSLLHMPELGEHLMTGDVPPRLRSRVVGLSSTVSPETIAVLQDIHEARIMGCAVYNMYNIARGSFSRFINPKGAYSWDLLAGLMIARENGCDILVDERPYDGSFLEAGRRYRVDIRHRYDLHSGQGPIC